MRTMKTTTRTRVKNRRMLWVGMAGLVLAGLIVGIKATGLDVQIENAMANLLRAIA